MFSSLFWPAVCSASRLTCQLPALLRPWLLAIFVATGALMATSLGVGQAYYYSAQFRVYESRDLIRAMYDMRISSRFLPFKHAVREYSATVSANIFGMHPDIALEELNRALAHDPHSASLLAQAGVTALRARRFHAAVRYHARLQAIDAGWKEVSQLSGMIEEVRLYGLMPGRSR